MKILFIPSSICGGMKNSASDRIRCDWVYPYLDAEKCNGSQNLNNYEVFIFMKSFPLRVAMQYNDKLIVWDISDVWRFNNKEEIDRCLKYVDLVLIPCESLKNDFVKSFPNTPAYVVPDGHKLEFWCIFKGLETKNKKVNYRYAEELAERMMWLGRYDLAAKCHQFLRNIFDKEQKILC